MIDYDMPLMDYDLKEMRKKAIINRDNDGNEYVKFKELMAEA